MCGIAGTIGIVTERNVMDQMLASMRRRGPDENGIFIDGGCCLLHSRLSIIDPEGGRQPMSIRWGGEDYTIVYNGELYNTDEIRNILTKLGHRFLGYSDTEVVAHAYAQWEEACLERFNGIFAFAVWQRRGRKLFVARDRIGVKPLFYAIIGEGFLFASEIKTILEHPLVEPCLDAQGAMELIMLGPGRLPGSGILKGIRELEPGCFGYFSSGKWNWKRYWRLKDREHTDNFEETAEYVRELLTDAIRRQMVSDVPVGTFLSGGLDSSLISAVCAKELEKKGDRLQTFSVDYRNNDIYFVPGKFQPNSDNHYIQRMEEELSSLHRWSVLSPEELIDALQEAMHARDLPGMADVDSSLLVFCGQIREHVKVALSGECADEIFGGYPWFRDPEVRALDGFPWAQNTKERSLFLTSRIRNCTKPMDFVMDAYRDTINRSDILPENNPVERRMKEMVNLNFRWFMQTLLDRKDRMSMYHGLEVRVPFCDYRIAEYLYAVPWEFKDYKGREKGLLRYAMADYLPEEVLYRKKSPYPKTYDPAYLQKVADMLTDLLKRKDAPVFEIMDRNALAGLVSTEYVWPWYGQLMKIPQTIAYVLQVNWWLEDYHIKIEA